MDNDNLKIGDSGEQVEKLQQYLIDLFFLTGTPDGYFGSDTRTAVLNFQKALGIPVTGEVDKLTWDELGKADAETLPSTLPTLRPGSSGVAVKSLQFRLASLGYLMGDADGQFGPLTNQAVRDFQASRGLVVDGIVGPATWREINNLFSAVFNVVPRLRPTLRPGDQSDDVLLAQNALAALDYPIYEPDGKFNEQMEEQVRQFQKDFNIEGEDGFIGPLTWSRLINLVAPPYIQYPLFKYGMSGPEIEVIQKKLQILGYLPYTPDGSFDQEMVEAVKQFQTNNGLPPSGIVDHLTYDYLYRATNIPLPLGGVASRPTLRLGDSGEYVRELQTDLAALGFFNGTINGIFNTTTQNAVIAFQTTNKLTADGVVGRNTWSALIYIYSPLAACLPDGQVPTPPQAGEGVVIDPGHGGSDPGASGNGIVEKTMNLQISQYMFNRFREMGVPVALTRSSDITLSPEDRIAAIKAPFGDKTGVILVSNHINSSGGSGAEVIYALRSQPTLPRLILDQLELAGSPVRSYYQRALPGEPTRDYYYIMRDTENLEPVLVEYGFLDNAEDAIRLQKYWPNFAEAVVKAVMEYKGLPYSAPEAGKIVYVVRAGDTLSQIAQTFGTTVAEIKSLNNLTSDVIQVGQELLIPGVGNETTPPSGNVVYIVKAGDTLSSIALKFNTTVTDIKIYNNLTSDFLTVGQKLYIPGISVTAPEGTTQIYVVEAGDTLSAIAQRFNTSVEYLRTLNNLTSDTLQIGQRLLVPRIISEPTFVYTVRGGDTLTSIARKFNTTVEEIRRLNNLTSDLLAIGQKLVIPGSGEATITHVVRSGDSLYALARQYNTSVDEIMRLNNLTSTTLQIGQELLIPYSPTQATTIHTVRSGDTLFAIASQYQTTVDEIMRLNNLTSTTLQIGQQLLVPATATQAASSSAQYHTIRGGDSLWSIAKQYSTTVAELKRLNSLSDNVIYLGRQLMIKD